MIRLNKKFFDNVMAKNLLNPTDLAKKAELSDATVCKIIKDSAIMKKNNLNYLNFTQIYVIMITY